MKWLDFKVCGIHNLSLWLGAKREILKAAIIYFHLRFEVLIAVKLFVVIVWVVKLCSLILLLRKDGIRQHDYMTSRPRIQQ
jgi:hypothetical protein